MTSAYDFDATDIDGNNQPLSTYQGKVSLIVNTASKCGFTPQYKGLEALQQKYQDRGFTVLGFPCNQFGKQEPGSEEQIKEFCETNFNVTFPMFAKIDVNGDNTHPLYQFLKKEQPGIMGTEAIKWNFTKFLVDKDGRVMERYASKTAPSELETAIEELL